MTLIYETKKREKTFLESTAELAEIESKTPEEAHRSIVDVLYNQQKLIDVLLQDNKELWTMIKMYEEKPITRTQSLIQKIWDNKEDEFWDTF